MTVLVDTKSFGLGVRARQVFADLKLEKSKKPCFQAGASFTF